jgi:hypothetical protein
MVECQLPKLKVASSSLVARSKFLSNSQIQFQKSYELLDAFLKLQLFLTSSLQR